MKPQTGVPLIAVTFINLAGGVFQQCKAVTGRRCLVLRESLLVWITKAEREAIQLRSDHRQKSTTP
jgi:hypothetical protein